MSYILDALQRADQERSLGEVPKLDMALQPSLVAQRRSWLPTALLVICVAAVAGGTAWWLEQGGLNKLLGESPQPATAAIAPETPKPAATPPATTAQVANVQPAPAPEPPAPEPATVVTKAEPVIEAAPAVPPEPAPEPKPPAKKRTARLPTPTVAPAPPPSWVREDKQEQWAEREQASAALTSYLGMPQSFRNSLPTLNMNAHVFSTNPSRSFVLINNKRYRIGDFLAEGPELVDVLPDGAVLKHRGETFHLPVQR